MRRIFVLSIVFSISLHTSYSQSIKLPSIFTDQMVLQQSTEAPIWGKAVPNSTIIITASWKAEAIAKANEMGKWMTKIKTPVAGGPYSITITDGKDKITLNDILIGEVWVCSGQSNMEMPLAGWPPNDTILTAKEEIKSANNPKIRMFTINRSFSICPVDSCIGSWALCNTENVGKFSATAYFFAKKLYSELKVPIGLIHSSWGGTPAESWTDEATLSKFPEYTEYFKNISTYSLEIVRLQEWINKHKKVSLPDLPDDIRWQNLDFGDMDCLLPAFNDSGWHQMELPKKFESSEVGEFDGAIWFRKQIQIPENFENKELEISLAMIDDMDIAYFDGHKIGGYDAPGAWQIVRKYFVPANLVKKGAVTIAVRVIDNQGGGGIWGKKEQLYIKLKNAVDSFKIDLSGNWKYLPVAEYLNNNFYIYEVGNAEFFSKPKLTRPINAYSPAVLYNAMLNPIIPYSIKGAIWYQGESNVGRAQQYEKLFPAMIKCWRSSWGQGDFPFYYVQIAPWEYSGTSNNESGWLRDAQRRTLVIPNTGMAVTLDIGNVKNIHPNNKKDVGDRLAFWALANDYNKKIEYSGPLYESAVFRGNKVVLTVSHKGSGLKLKNNDQNEFEIAGADGQFFPAECTIEKDNLKVWSEKVPVPQKVRYAFKNGSQAILFNNEGLPAPSFTTESKIE
jgi:sialate O-acetylesterase